MKHANISIFVPHMGCRFRCSFCNQVNITGSVKTPHAEDVDKAVKIALSSPKYDPQNTEIAFFGGSFTAVERSYMCELLSAAEKYVKNGAVAGIRLSTRPDAIDREVLEILKSAGVTSIELGAQSMSDRVLGINNRGHLSEDVKNASRLIKEYGFSLGLQMMTGLYGSTVDDDRKTANELAKLKPDTVRIYPTIVLKNTELAKLYKQGIYEPPTLSQTVKLCGELLDMFQASGIKVIRLGLHSVEKESYIAGPLHPSLRELCESEIYLALAQKALKGKEKGKYILFVNDRAVSKMTGQKRANIEKLRKMGYDCRVTADSGLCDREINLKMVW